MLIAEWYICDDCGHEFFAEPEFEDEVLLCEECGSDDTWLRNRIWGGRRMSDPIIKGLDDAEVAAAVSSANKGGLWLALMRVECIVVVAAETTGDFSAVNHVRKALGLSKEQWERIAKAGG